MGIDSTSAIHCITKVASASLVFASASFGAVYAYKVGSETSILLGCITVLFAVALELIKPLALSAAFNAFGQLALMRGICLTALGLIGAAYSLTAELSLISMSSGDLAAHRAATARQSTIQGERIEAARKELAGLPETRSATELEALVEGTRCAVDATTGRGSHALANATCPKLTKLKGELGRAKRKAELESLIGSAATSKEAPAAVENGDPGAANLAMYLNALGLNVSSETVGRWLALIPTLAIELGSSLAAILVSSIAVQPKDDIAQHRNDSAQRKNDPAQPNETAEAAKSRGVERLIQASQLVLTPAISASAQPNSNIIPYVARPKANTRQSAEEEIVRQLKLHGSSAAFGAQRQMAFTLGIDRSTFNRAATELAKRGVIHVEQEGNRVVMKMAS